MNRNILIRTKLCVLVLMLLNTGSLSAQNTDDFETFKAKARAAFDAHKTDARRDYDEFRRKANEEYARFMAEAWEAMKAQKGETPPPQPKPKRAPEVVPDHLPSYTPLPQPQVAPEPRVVPPPPLPDIPDVPEPAPSAPSMEFAVYNTPCSVHATDDLRFHLKRVDNKGAAEAWKELASGRYEGMLGECLALRKQMHLNDWGYIRLLQQMSEKLQGKGSNEAVLLQMYLLVQSGYKARIAKQGNSLVLLVPFDHPIYNYTYIPIDGLHYYALAKNLSGSVEVCNVAYPKEQTASIVMGTLPTLAAKPSASRTFEARHFGTMKVNIAVNKNLIDFLNDYPRSSAWDCYARTPLSEEVKSALYPVLRSQIKGKSQQKAAYMLLDFVQTAFNYATDQEQFGTERPLFADESFFYPKNDCEDRSILYSILVRDLLGLDVVLVHWEGHLGTAVCFTDEVQGDYFTIDGKRYVVCDPTYIGASVGMTMPQFKQVSANIIKL